jgi:AcrR family transcriptional regulator
MGRAVTGEVATEQRILEAASLHLRRHGVAHFSVSAIARDAGMTHANVYRYFPSKAALVEAVTAAWLRPLEADLRAVADGPDPAYDKLERILLALHRAYRAKLDLDPSLFDVFTDALAKGDGVARKHRIRVQSEIQRIIEEGIAGGAFGLGEPRRALALIIDSTYRFLHPMALGFDREVPAQALASRLERLIKVVLRSLASGRL